MLDTSDYRCFRNIRYQEFDMPFDDGYVAELVAELRAWFWRSCSITSTYDREYEQRNHDTEEPDDAEQFQQILQNF